MMAPRIKTFSSIINDMINWITSYSSKLTNFRVGSVIRTLLEAIAVEIESLYFEMYRSFKYAIENAIYTSFRFDKYPAVASNGAVQITFMSALVDAIVFPKGYKFYTVMLDDNVLYFETTQEYVAPIGSTNIEVQVACTKTGVSSNVPYNSIRYAVSRFPQILNITNSNAFNNGMDEESSEDRKKRFAQFIDNLSRGTIPAIVYGSKIPGVAGVSVVNEPSCIKIYAHDSGGTLSDSMRNDILTNLVEYAPGGVELQVLAVVPKTVDFSIHLTLLDPNQSTKYIQLVSDSVFSYLNTFVVGKSLIRADLIRFIMNLDEDNILNVVLGINSDVDIQDYELIRPGYIPVYTD